MKEDLNYLLFKREVSQKGSTEKKPLFRFQSELANEIVILDTDYRGKAPESIRPYLNQILKPGDSPYQKPISAEMRTAIIVAIKNRLNKNDELFQSIESAFDSAYNILKQKAKTRNTQTDETEYNELLQWQEKSNRTVILNREPSEAKWHRDKDEYLEVKELMNLTIQNLFKNFAGKPTDICNQILQSDPLTLSSEDRNQQYFYRFYVPSFTAAKQVWQGFLNFILLEVLKHEFKHKTVHELIEPACHLVDVFNSFQQIHFMRVFKVDGYLTSIPLVFFESSEEISGPENTYQHEALFSLVLYNGELHSVSKVTGEDLDFWKEQVYYPLHWSKSRVESFNAEEIKFSNVVSHIKRTLNK